ncbi:unnamed protein product [Schistosoma mattheei]|uniref:Protein RIC1 homolog n=1 Tax=Schistosoma mattheei TaxID=31246 RepID=A0AA85BR63_9TREM|nr:unnamed protein product [Schistosoma mattheei]
MHYFVGWPSVLESYYGETSIVCTSSDVVVFHLKFLCAIAHFSRSNLCLTENGLTSSAVLKWDSSKILLCTDKGTVLIYSVKNLQSVCQSLDPDSVPGPPIEIFFLKAIRVAECKCSVFSLGEAVIVATEKGGLIKLLWDGSYYGESINLRSINLPRDIKSFSDKNSEEQVYCKTVEWAPTFGGAFALFSSGHIALFVSLGAVANQTDIEVILVENVGHPTCTAVNNRFRTLAVGTESNEVLLYKMDETSGVLKIKNTLRISGRESSYTIEEVGPVSEISWSPDGYTLAVVWLRSGWSLWSVFGALLYTSLSENLSQFGKINVSNLSWAHHGYNIVGLLTLSNVTEISGVANTDSFVSEKVSTKDTAKEGKSQFISDGLGCPSQNSSYLVVFHLARSSITANPTSDNHLHIVLQTTDRIIVTNKDLLTSRMQTENLLIPKQYINSNWPVRYVAVSTDGKKIAVSGRNGFIHYNTDSQRWHVFGNIKQENSLHVFGGMAWWKQYICLTCFTENYGTSEVRVYSSDHKLDNQFSSICDLPSLTLPVIVDNFENLFLVLTNDGCLQIFGLSESVSSKSTVTVSPFKAVNLTDIVIFPACVVRICFTTLKSNAPFTRTTTSGSNLFRNFDPGLCSVESLVMNYSGDVFMLQRSFLDFTPKSHSGTPEEINQQNMVVFDQLLSFGTPLLVASEIEILWSTSCFTTITSQADNDRLSSLNVIDANAYTKDSLWLYSGATGLSVWLPLPQVPSSLAFSFNYESVRSDTNHKFSSDHDSSSVLNYDYRRIMLSFELGGDLYPLSICFQEGLLVGVLNEFHRCWNKSLVHCKEDISSDLFALFPCGTLLIKIQVALHHIIRQLLKKNLGIHAFQMSLAYQHLPYFPRILELLLHEVLEVEAASKIPTPDPLLPQVVAFIQEFSDFLEILAHCSRKTDVTWWPHLFITIGRKPKDLFELCLENNKLETAASFLILLQTSEPLSVSWECALTLFRASLQSMNWNLIRDLLRFLCAIDPTEYSSSDEHSRKKDFNKSHNMYFNPCNHLKNLSNLDNDHMQLKAGPEESINKVVWYGGMSKYRPTRVPIELLDLGNDQIKDLCNRIEISSDSSVTHIQKPSSTLRNQLEQLLFRVAVDYFSQGYLKRASQLVTNIPEIFNDGFSTGHTNVLQMWLNKNIYNIQPEPNWPQVFLNLLKEFNLVVVDSNRSGGIYSCSTSPNEPLLNSSIMVQIDNTFSESSPFNFDFRSTFDKGTLCQLRYLLNQLTLARSKEWICLISLLCLDRDAFLRSFSMAFNWTMFSDYSEIHQNVSATDLCLKKLITGLSEIKQWSHGKIPAYYYFLESCEPHMKVILEKMYQISDEKNKVPMASTFSGNTLIEDDIVNEIQKKQMMELKSSSVSSITDTYQYSKACQLNLGQDCLISLKVAKVSPSLLDLTLSSAMDEAVVLKNNPVDRSGLLDSHHTSLNNSSCSTPIILSNEAAITKHWTSSYPDRWKSVDDPGPLGRLVVLNLNETDNSNKNEYLFDGTAENFAVGSLHTEQRTCSVM